MYAKGYIARTIAETFEERGYRKKNGDFKLDGKYVFEVGGATKNFDQVADIPDSYILADDIELPVGNKLPLWLAGLLY